MRHLHNYCTLYHVQHNTYQQKIVEGSSLYVRQGTLKRNAHSYTPIRTHAKSHLQTTIMTYTHRTLTCMHPVQLKCDKLHKNIFQVRIHDPERCEKFVQIFARRGCKMLEMSVWIYFSHLLVSHGPACPCNISWHDFPHGCLSYTSVSSMMRTQQALSSSLIRREG